MQVRLDWRAILGNRWLRVAVAALAIGLSTALVARFIERADVAPALTVTPWTPDAMRQPFPVPARQEPPGGSGLAQTSLVPWVDSMNDGRPGTDLRVDLITVDFWPSCQRANQLCVYFEPAQPHIGPLPEPDTEWISYGAVFDNDGDGLADGRLGLDNIPDGFYRAWFDHPLTGETKVRLASRDHGADGGYGESEFPRTGSGRRLNNGYMWIIPGIAGTIDNPNGQFYMWAALVRGDRIVSLDYAPDIGWLKMPYRR